MACVFKSKHVKKLTRPKLLTSGLCSDLVQPCFYCLLIDATLFEYLRLQQSDVAFLEVDDNGAGDVLTFFGAHCHHRRQTPLQIIQPHLPLTAY